MTAIRCASPTTTSIRCSTISTVLPSSWWIGADQRDEVVDVLDRDAGHRLVEQDHVRLPGQQHRDLELALVALREQAGGPGAARREADPLERLLGPLGADRGRPPPDLHRAAELGVRGEADVLEHAQQREDARDLERAPEPGAGAPEGRLAGDVTTLQLDRAGRRPRQPGEQVEERRLAGAVRPDDPDELARADLERDIGDDVARRRCRARGSAWRGSVRECPRSPKVRDCRLARLRRGDELALDPGDHLRLELAVHRSPA